MRAVRNAIAVLGLMALQGAVQACPVCFGDPNDPQTAALNAAIMTLLGITAFMLSTIGGSIAFFVVRAKRYAIQSVPADGVQHGEEVRVE